MNNRLRQARASRGDDAASRLEARFARRVALRLSESAEATPPGVAERLRFARTQALERARFARPALAPAAPTPLQAPVLVRGVALAGAGRAAPPREPSAWWMRLAAALPLAALLGGLALIQQQHVSEQIAAAAEIDADLLTDAVPPSAYNDAGFLEFLKAPQN